MQNIISVFCKNTRSLLILSIAVLSFSACNTPQIGIVKNKRYGGQISGQIHVDKQRMDAFFDSQEALLAYLKENLRVKELVVDDYQVGQLIHTEYSLSDCDAVEIDIEPVLRVAASGAEKVIIDYSVGVWSDRPILSPVGQPNALGVKKPYRVFINELWKGSRYISFLESRQHSSQPYTVVYLTDCDRQFSCYDFQANTGSLT